MNSASRFAAMPILTVAIATLLHAQTPSGRIAGRVTDSAGSALPGVQVALIAQGVSRSLQADAEGRFEFDGLDSDRLYTVTGQLSGFVDGVQDRIDVESSRATTVNISLRVYLPFGSGDHAVSPVLDELLTTSAVVHLRVADVAHLRRIDTGSVYYEEEAAPATIVGVGRLARDEWRTLGTIALTSDDLPLKPGAEYLAFLTYFPSTQEFGICEDYSWNVKSGRVEAGPSLTELGIRDGVPVGEALTRLQAIYRHHTRYRRYEDITVRTPLETLKHKTGWLLLGVLEHEAWTDGGQSTARPFDFVETSDRSRNVPRRGDLIRLAKGGGITILDYGSRGEALRAVSPTTREDRYISDDSGRRVDPGVAYRVADLQLESGYGDFQLVWVRLIAQR